MLLIDKKTSDVHEFKPILTELQEEPINPLARAIFWLTFATVAFFIAWSILGQVDIVISAPGKVIPDGHAKELQPLDTGIISKIMVKEGDLVHKGQPLIEIDPSVTSDELLSSRQNFRHTRLEIERIQSALTDTPFSASGAAGDAALAAQRMLYDASRNGLQKQLESKMHEQEKAKEEFKQTQAEIAKNESLLDRSKAKRERLTPVIDLIPRDEWDKNESDITTYRGNIDEQQHKLDELTHQELELAADIEKIKADYQTSNLQDLSQKQKDATDLYGKVRELSFKQRKQMLLAPVSGRIDTIYAHTVGGVVSTGEKLLSIIPTGSHLMVQASVSNRDIGFIAKGMLTQLKIDTFDFQKYGMFQGKVKRISIDSHDSEAKQETAGEKEQTEKKLEQVYEVLIQPTTQFLMVEGKKQPLRVGMTLTAEIKVGKRRIIEFFIYPLIKYWHDGITVR